jgi:HEAT repeat protein
VPDLVEPDKVGALEKLGDGVAAFGIATVVQAPVDRVRTAVAKAVVDLGDEAILERLLELNLERTPV